MAKPQTDRNTFLNRLWRDSPGGFVDLRAIPVGGGRPVQKFVTTAPEIEAFANKYGQKGSDYSVFFGVAKRARADGKKNAVGLVTALWADVDTLKDGVEIAALYKLLAQLPEHLQPSAVVESGGGLHLYWFLDEATASHAEIEEANIALRDMVGGDAVQDVSRVLRLPDTFNNKRAKKAVCKVAFIRPHATVDVAMIVENVRRWGKQIDGDKWVDRKTINQRAINRLGLDRSAVFRAVFADRKAATMGSINKMWSDRVRLRAPRGYIGVHEAALVTTARLLCNDIPYDTIVGQTLAKMRMVQERDAPGERWDWKQEEAAIKKMVDDWAPKWAVLKKQRKDEMKAAKNVQPSQT